MECLVDVALVVIDVDRSGMVLCMLCGDGGWLVVSVAGWVICTC